MRVVIQRVTEATVTVIQDVGGREVLRMGVGVVALVGFTSGDGDDALKWVARRIPDLRIFPGTSGEMDRSLRDMGGGLMVISQFTLYADLRKGRRPDFTAALPYADAERLFDGFVALSEAELPGRVASGVFGARMEVSLVNDGPVTLILER